jgi:hypothetical protein
MIDYAIVGGPPADWADLEVSLDGVLQSEVIEANAREGWIRRYQRRNGALVFSSDSIAQETVNGEVKIFYKQNGKHL